MTNKTNKKETITLIVDRLHIYKDFIINLTGYIFKYYIDDGSFDKNDERNFHKWCFNKVCDEFKEEGLDFSDNTDLENILFEYNNKYFFNTDIRKMDVFINFWNSFFDVYNQKNENVIALLIQYYTLFDKSIKIKSEKTCLTK